MLFRAGVVNVDGDRLDAFDRDAELCLVEIANLMAPVIGTAWSHESARQKGRLLESLVRVGQAIFGARALPDSHYWPVRSDPDTPH